MPKKVVPSKRLREDREGENSGTSQELHYTNSIDSDKEKKRVSLSGGYLTHSNRDAKIEELHQCLMSYNELYDEDKHQELPAPDELRALGIKSNCRNAYYGTVNKDASSRCLLDLDFFIQCYARISKDKRFSRKVKPLPWLEHYHSKHGKFDVFQGKAFRDGLRRCHESTSMITKQKYTPTLIVNFLLETLEEKLEQPPPPKDQDSAESEEAIKLKNSTIDRLLDALDRDIQNDPIHHAFLQHFHDNLIRKHLGKDAFYCRSITFLNSSGMGKSRLVRGLGLQMPTFVITLGMIEKEATSVPVPDESVCEYFNSYGQCYPGQVVAAAFLSALFNKLYVYIAMKYDPKAGLHYSIEGQILAGSQEMTKLAETKVVLPNQGKMELGKDILAPMREPFSGKKEEVPEEDVNIREAFLDSVVSLAGDIISRRCRFADVYEDRFNPPVEKDSNASKKPKITKETVGTTESKINEIVHDSGNNGTVKQDNDEDAPTATSVPVYLEKTLLLDNLKRFFNLIDNVKGARAQDDGTKVAFSNLTQHSTTKARPVQFMFGIDKCRHLKDSLIYGERKGGKDDVFAFAQLMYDLEQPEGKTSPTSSPASTDLKIEGTEGRRRVWLALLDTTSNTEMLAPQTEADRLLPSHRCKYTIALGSCWHSFGANHPYLKTIKADQDYWDKLTMSQMHQFEHLSLFGRGIWNAYGVPKQLCFRAVLKLICEPIGLWTNVLLFKDSSIVTASAAEAKGSLSEVAFAVASLRFSTDTGVMTRHGGFSLIVKSMAKHMRVLDKIGKDGGLMTSTPCEPVLAVAALAIMNYCYNFFQESPPDGKQKHVETTPLKGKRDDHVWKNLLIEMTHSLRASFDLIKIGDAGELLGRMVLTHARDCTLPDEWDFVEGVPYTTLGRFIQCLVDDPNEGSGPSVKILEQLDLVDPRLRHSLVNFNQFVPIDGPLKNISCKYDVDKPISHGLLLQAFGQSTALICHPNQPGIDHVIPILVPKQASNVTAEPSTEEIMRMHKDKTFKNYDLAYVGIDNKMNTRGQKSDNHLVSPGVKDGFGKMVQHCAAIVITMDMGTKSQFAAPEKGNEEQPRDICPYIKADVLEYKNSPPAVPDESTVFVQVTQKYLALRIRGMNKAYLNWASLDIKGSFQDAAYGVMNDAKEDYNESTGDKTVHFRYNLSKEEYEAYVKETGEDPYLT